MNAAVAAVKSEAESVPYTSLTIAGLTFDVAQPYKEGHQLTAGEASQLNVVRAENIRNNFAGTVRKAKEEYAKANSIESIDDVPVDALDKDALAEQLAEYDDKYEMGIRGGPGGVRRSVDPVQREAERIALEKVKVAIKKKGITFTSVPKEKLDAFVAGTIAKYPDIMVEAKRRVDSAASIALDVIEV